MGRPGEGRPMQQRSFGSVEYEHKKVKTRRQAISGRVLERSEHGASPCKSYHPVTRRSPPTTNPASRMSSGRTPSTATPPPRSRRGSSLLRSRSRPRELDDTRPRRWACCVLAPLTRPSARSSIAGPPHYAARGTCRASSRRARYDSRRRGRLARAPRRASRTSRARSHRGACPSAEPGTTRRPPRPARRRGARPGD